MITTKERVRLIMKKYDISKLDLLKLQKAFGGGYRYKEEEE